MNGCIAGESRDQGSEIRDQGSGTGHAECAELAQLAEYDAKVARTEVDAA
jgi:hypothetical protein